MSTIDILTTSQRRFLVALLSARDVRAAAGMAGISEPSAWRYLRKPAFRAELSVRVDALLRAATAGLADDAATARATLTSVCKDVDAPPSARVASARAILEVVLRLSEVVDLEQRIEQIEQRLSESGANNGTEKQSGACRVESGGHSQNT